MSIVQWPYGKKFAFSMFDDTDLAVLDNVKPVYDVLKDLNIYITKSVWPSKGAGTPVNGGATCDDAEYVKWLLDIQRYGFEIGYHLNTYHTSTRQQILAGLDRFKELFGHDPMVAANHVGCRDAIYWGATRLGGERRLIYNLANRFKTRDISRGHVEGDELFLGDTCRDRVKYVRSFVFKDVNSLRHCPFMPYHDPAKPYVNDWFTSSDGADLQKFLQCISEEQQDRLERDGGCCIIYTHLAKGFFDATHGVHKEFQHLMQTLSRRNGWFAPASIVLDYLKEQRGPHIISDSERRGLEWAWLLEKLRTGRS